MVFAGKTAASKAQLTRPQHTLAGKKGLASLIACLVATGLSFTLLSTGCSSDAVGVDACRAIEEVRCEAAAACGLEGAEDVEACQRFYKSHCLHGLATETEPRSSSVKACQRTIQAAGNCAKNGQNSLGDCAALSEVRLSNSILTVCDIVLQPDQTSSCSFLYAEEEPNQSSGGSGGSMSSPFNGGTSGGGSQNTGGTQNTAGTQNTGGAGGSAGSSAGASTGGSGT